MANDYEHPDRTRRSGYRYLFASKHHGAGSASDARWAKEISDEEEFSVFDGADSDQIQDDRKWLYGVLVDQGILRELGTWQQQIAEFPFADQGVPWHGYPIWPLNQKAPSNRSGEKMRPTKVVFERMVQAGLITEKQKRRLFKGDHA